MTRSAEEEATYSLALKYRAEGAVLSAKADTLEGIDPSTSYEKAAEYFRMHAEAEIAAIRKALLSSRKH